MSIMNGLLAGVSKPRNRYEWTERFVSWRTPASDTEEAKIDAASRAIARALAKSRWLEQQGGYTLIKQGSYHNNTNVRNHSDVDVAVRMNTNHYFKAAYGDVELSREELGLYPLAFTFDEYRNEVAGALRDHFGADAVRIGNKSIKLHGEDDDKVDADVVPALNYQLYRERKSWLTGKPVLRAEGIGFTTLDGKLIFNFPEQHYENGVAKNDRTSRRFKRVVRILKRLRNHMADNGVQEAQGFSSFLIECLVFNCPDTDFASDDLYDCVREALLSIWDALKDPNRGKSYTEVNDIKLLFHESQPWTVEQVRAFVHAAWTYVEFE